jgi:hypothetical protein
MRKLLLLVAAFYVGMAALIGVIAARIPMLGNLASYEIVHVGKTIDAIALDLSVPPSELLAQVQAIAERIRASVPSPWVSVA